jgi:hypothetical protein
VELRSLQQLGLFKWFIVIKLFLDWKSVRLATVYHLYIRTVGIEEDKNLTTLVKLTQKGEITIKQQQLPMHVSVLTTSLSGVSC